ncbi:NADPH2:quinone reductase [Halogranum amylolyticum]|uniref:NADPH2:quinone reductase n=1 Tax=Halogranum amylolyticum TaxID=660520 RepID=A0A1H8UYT3_9EURY|nr:alcohol dehydrogenase catalytic domain-containing protein [Halogranum amylolyticum]SEP08309.1 NADPH2:quinone reductase [Halogranum amylolyticum]
MRVASLTDIGEMEVEERERPEPEPSEVVVRVGACGVCSTDLHMYHGSFAVDFPVVLGHESAGTVTELGDDVSELEPGDRVAVNPAVPCGACSYCKRGETNLCDNATAIGGAGDRIIDGSFAEYVRVPASNVEKVGDLPFHHAALAEPLGCCIHAADRSGVGQGDSVALVGAGPIGLLMLQTLRNRGASPIAVSELDPKRRELAAEMGADLVVDPEAGDPVETIREEIGEVDAGIEVVGLVPTIQQAYDVTAKGGNTLIVGVPKQEATMEISPFELYYNDLDIRGTFALTQDSFERAVSLLRQGRIDAAPLVTEEIGLKDIPTAFERMENNEGLKKVVIPSDNE